MPATKEQIADVFQRHVERFGLQKATVEDVAAELRISKKTIYEHFSSKADLYHYVIGRMAEESRGGLLASVKDLPTWGDKVEALMRLALSGARAHIDQTSGAQWHQEYQLAGDAYMAALTGAMQELAQGGIDAGEFVFPDAAIAQQLLGAMVLKYVFMVRERPALNVDEELATAVRRFLG